MIRGYGGRVDNVSVGSKSGYITFVIPKSSFASFVVELKDLAPKRFLTENVNTQNLLPQKQHIENQTETTSQRLDTLETNRQSLINTHNARVTSLQRQINTYANSIAVLKSEATTSTVRQQEIDSSVASLEAKQRAVKQQLSNENAQYKSNLQYLDADIQSMKAQLANLGKQNQNLLNDVETVDGYISLQWISVFEVVNLYVPVNGIIISLCGVIIVGYFLYGRRRSFELDVL
jgi:polyhydroxyalkanoate synthesis regulator phasin